MNVSRDWREVRMTTEQVHQTSQLDRIEGQLNHVDSQVGQVLQRVARMEERQDSQAASVDSHRVKLDHHDQRIVKIEIEQARQVTSQAADATRSDGRWSSAGAIGLVILGAVLSLAGYLVLARIG